MYGLKGQSSHRGIAGLETLFRERYLIRGPPRAFQSYQPRRLLTTVPVPSLAVSDLRFSTKAQSTLYVPRNPEARDHSILFSPTQASLCTDSKRDWDFFLVSWSSWNFSCQNVSYRSLWLPVILREWVILSGCNFQIAKCPSLELHLLFIITIFDGSHHTYSSLHKQVIMNII